MLQVISQAVSINFDELRFVGRTLQLLSQSRDLLLKIFDDDLVAVGIADSATADVLEKSRSRDRAALTVVVNARLAGIFAVSARISALCPMAMAVLPANDTQAPPLAVEDVSN